MLLGQGHDRIALIAKVLVCDDDAIILKVVGELSRTADGLRGRGRRGAMGGVWRIVA